MYSRAGRIPPTEIFITLRSYYAECMSLIYIVLAIIAISAMAKRKGKARRRFNLRMVRTSAQLALGTLGNVTVINGAVFGNADGAYRIMSTNVLWTMKNLTAGEGPIHVGYAHGDYTVTEIKEAIESASSISIGNMVEQERGQRRVRLVGSFSGEVGEEALNEGRKIRTKLNWLIPIGTNFNMFAYNDSGVNPLTTGAIVDHTGQCWVLDK